MCGEAALSPSCDMHIYSEHTASVQHLIRQRERRGVLAGFVSKDVT